MNFLSRIGLTLWIAAVAIVPLGAQHRDLEEGYPVQMEDTTPIDFGVIQAKVPYEYRSFRRGTHDNIFVPGFEIGFAPNWMAELLLPAAAGSTESIGNTFLTASVLTGILSEQSFSPSVALRGSVDMPGYNIAAGSGIRLKIIVTKVINPATDGRLHLNAAYGIKNQPAVNERPYTTTASFGYSRRVRADTTLAFDYAYEESRTQGITFGTFEAGFRRTVTNGIDVSFGIGKGIFGSELDWRVLLGIQVMLCDLVCPTGAL